jgi:hypothetical protein
MTFTRRIRLPRHRPSAAPAAPVVPSLVVERDDGMFALGWGDDSPGPFESRQFAHAVWWASNHSTATAAGEFGR